MPKKKYSDELKLEIVEKYLKENALSNLTNRNFVLYNVRGVEKHFLSS